jgi:hypothetical protein
MQCTQTCGTSENNANKMTYSCKHIKKQERFQINNLSLQFKEQEKQHTKFKTKRRKEIMKIRAYIN